MTAIKRKPEHTYGGKLWKRTFNIGDRIVFDDMTFTVAAHGPLRNLREVPKSQPKHPDAYWASHEMGYILSHPALDRYIPCPYKAEPAMRCKTHPAYIRTATKNNNGTTTVQKICQKCSFVESEVTGNVPS